MINLSLDDPEFFQKLNASRPDLFDQEKMAKNIEDERSYPMPTDRPQTIDDLLKQVFVAGLDCRDEGVVWGTEEWSDPAYDEAKAALSEMVAEILEDSMPDSNETLEYQHNLRQRAIKLGFSIKEDRNARDR